LTECSQVDFLGVSSIKILFLAGASKEAGLMHAVEEDVASLKGQMQTVSARIDQEVPDPKPCARMAFVLGFPL